MEPLHTGQSVTYFDAGGVPHAAAVIEPYAQAALVNVPDLGVNLVAQRLRFESGPQPFPYISDADGGSVTETSFEAPVAEE